VKKLEKDIFFKVFLLIVGVAILFYLVTYSYFKYFTIEVLANKNLSSTQIINEFNSISIELALVTIVLVGILFILLKKTTKKILDDLNELNHYVEDISQNKNYDAVIHIKNYIEFLQISIQLKNIIKRVYKKDKK